MKDYIGQICAWYLNKRSKKQQETKQKIQDEKLKEVVTRLKQLETFVKFLNEKAFANRHERKKFWSDVQEGHPVIENTLKRILERYGVKEETIKELEKRKMEKFEAMKVEDKRRELEAREAKRKSQEKSCTDCAEDCSKCEKKPQPSEDLKKDDVK